MTGVLIAFGAFLMLSLFLAAFLLWVGRDVVNDEEER